MTHAALTTSNGSAGCALNEMLPVDPFRSLYVHFGMLLGVEDFRTVDAYHRGKMWFHSAWLHREGTLWGLAVLLDRGAGEARVKPGAAIDPLGRELYLNAPACLNLGAWYEEHKEDPELSEIVTVDPDSGHLSFDAHVVIKFKGCLTRQVPALREPCDGSNTITAYSRVAESVELSLLPGKAPEWRGVGQLPFHRVRLLFGLETAQVDDKGEVTPEDEAVLDKRASILSLPAEDQPRAYLKWLRHFSALDEMEMSPAADGDGAPSFLFPAIDPAAVPLANIEKLTLANVDGAWEVISGEVDNTIRPVHLPTSTLQELLCGPRCGCADGAEASPAASPEEAPVVSPQVDDAGGPRIDPASVTLEGETLTFTLQGPPLMKASVDARALSITSFDTRDGWISSEIKSVNYEPAESKITIALRDKPGGTLVRLIVMGTGHYPLLGRIGLDRIPLAGAVGGAPGSLHQGNDFVFMFKTGS